MAKMNKECMKKYLTGCWIAFTALSITSCKKTTVQQNVSHLSAYNYLMTYQYTLFATALKLRHLDTLGSHNGALNTYFVPSDSAMTQAGFTMEALPKLDSSALDTVIKYHIVVGEVVTKDLNAYIQTDLTTVSPDEKAIAYLEQNNFGIFVNGIRLVQTDMRVANGIIHTIGEVLEPPKGDIVHTIAMHPELSLLYFAIQQDTAGFSSTLATLNRGGPLTLLAPNNLAYQAVGLGNKDTIVSRASNDGNFIFTTVTQLYNANQYFTSDFFGKFTWPNYHPNLNSPISVIFTNDHTFQGPDNLTPGHITGPNIMCYNGVIHIIDQYPY